MTIQARLKKVLRDGNLTVADLSRWFDCPYPTVRSWVFNGASIGGGPRDIEYIERRLERLEKLVRTNPAFPVPRLSPSARLAHLRGFIRH